MFRLKVWTREYVELGTIERPTAGELLDLGSRLQKDYGASYKLEWIEEEPVCTEEACVPLAGLHGGDCRKCPRKEERA